MSMDKLPDVEELYEMYKSGMSVPEIAEKYHVRYQLIQKRLKKAGYRLRSHSEANKLSYQRGRKEKKGTSGPDHWAWKGGQERVGYRKGMAKEKCETCGSRQNLAIHHKDFDHYNNASENLQVLCVSCHMSLHKKAYWDAMRVGKEPPRSNGPIGWET